MKRNKLIYMVALALLVIAVLLTKPEAEKTSEPVVLSISTEKPTVAPEQIFVPEMTATLSSSKWYQIYFSEPGNGVKGKTPLIEQALIQKIQEARRSIDIAYFEFDLEPVAVALIEAQSRGVNVRIVYDNEHSDPDPQTQEMVKAGILAVADQRSAYMHNKFLVIDNNCVWTGSYNYTMNATFKNNENAIYFCQSEIAANYEQEFMEMLDGKFGPDSPADTPNPHVKIQDKMVDNYFAPEDGVMDKIILEVSQAKKSIHFMAFSFTDTSLSEQMMVDMKKGVQVVGIFESRGASANTSQCGNLLNNKAEVYLDGNPYTFHHKVIIIDASTVIFGSFNFSGNANRSNDENVLIVHDPDLAIEFEKEFAKRLTEAKEPLPFCNSK